MNPEVPAPANNRWPPQIKYIIGNEAAERFSYYGMVSILMVYITDVLEKSKDDSAFIIHGFKFFNYFMPLIGAWVSDRFWGRYKTILWISLAYCLGHGVLAFSDVAGTKEARTICLYAGLALIAFGSGGIKPCVSAFLGDQFQSNQRHLLQKAYAAFYWAINFGSFFSMLLIPQIKNHSWAWAFGVPGILMAVATLIFWLGARHYVMVPPARTTRKAGFFAVLVAALKNRSPGKGFWDGAKTLYSETEVRAAASVGPILSIFALIPVFWALFDQTHTTWIAQGQKMIPIALPFDWKLDASAMQSINPLMDDTCSAAHVGGLPGFGEIRLASQAHGFRILPCRIQLRHRRLVANTRGRRRADEHPLASVALPHSHHSRGFSFHHRIGIRIPRSRALNEKHHHGFLESKCGTGKSGGDGDYQSSRHRRWSRVCHARKIHALRWDDFCGGNPVHAHRRVLQIQR